MGESLRRLLGCQILVNIAGIPPACLDDEIVVAKQFRPKTANGLYDLRMADILGARLRCARVAGNDPVVKASGSASTEGVEPDPVISEWRRRFHLDYGKMDYVVSEGCKPYRST